MPPYTKTFIGTRDEWHVTNGDGDRIAATETETLADHVMSALLGEYANPISYEPGRAYPDTLIGSQNESK